MLAKILAVVLLVEATLCQESEDSVRRLRFRRPRPKLIDVENPEGDLRGSPVELNLAESALTPSRPQSSGNAALEALIATAQREDKPAGPPQPQVLEIEEVPTQRPLRAQEADARPATRSRTRGNLNGVNRRPRPQGGERSEERRRPNGPREDPIATLERYSHKNDDGSFTFGYVAADGSFREETRGVDCITRGKYGYIDPEGVKREYTYTSGLPCTEDEEESEDNLQSLDGDISIDDPVDPKERFRQTVSEQLSEDQIPVAARPRRPVQRRPAQKPAESEAPASSSQFANFGANRAVVPERRPTPNRVTPRPRPAPQPASSAGSFDFDAELDGFTLNRPAIKFDNAPAANPNSFSSSIAFNQNSGTFQTSLQQNVQGGVALNLQNQAAPAGTTAAPRTTIPIRTTSQTFAPTPATPAPTAATPAPSVQTIPAGTIKLDFQPLNIPNIAAVKTPVALPPATSAPEAPRQSQPAAPATPKPVPAAAPTPAAAAPAAPSQPANTFFVFSPFGQQQPQPAPNARPVPSPINPNAFHIRPVSSSAPAPQRAPAPVQQRAPAPVPQRAPAPVPQRAPAPAAAPAPAVQRIPQQPASVQRIPAPQPVQARPAPQPVQPRPAAVPQRIVPSQPQQVVQPQSRPIQSTPQLQFGFQPVSQGQQRPAPFTAFSGGAPRQRPVQQVQLGVPPQLQAGQQRPAAAAPQFAQFDSRFQPQARPQAAQPGQPQLRPAQFQPGSRPAAAPQFSVFNPLQAFRGA